MPDIRHRIGVEAPIEEVYRGVATRDGLSGWWTRDVTGESEVGSTLAFSFGGPEPAAIMEVTELTPPRRVRWLCAEGPDEWKGTTLAYELKEEDGQTIVLFTHAGWHQPSEFLHHCSTRWAYFLMSLRAGLGGGKATPWPEDEQIDNWGSAGG